MKASAVFTIFKKELARFFKDRRTLVALLMPGILIYFIYSFMGGAMSKAFIPDDEYKYEVRAVSLPESIKSIAPAYGLDIEEAGRDEIGSFKDMISDGGIDMLIVFPEDFDSAVAEYEASSGVGAPNVEVYFNSSSTSSTAVYQAFTSLLDLYESSMTNKFDVNMGEDTYDLATEKDITGMIFSMLMPMLLIMLLFSGCMAVAPESISGEKERGTIASLLVTPAKRSHIAIGKILALSLMALLSGASSTLGVVLSLPKLMGGTMAIDGSVYSLSDYALLALVILSTVLLLITVISIISAFAKTVKEASSYVLPLMIVCMLVGLSGMFGMSANNAMLYCIPIYNSVQSMIGIFSFGANAIHILITVISNIVFTSVGVFILTRMFGSEKIMFNK